MIKTGAFKGTGNKWLLVMGITLGLISAVLAFVYLRSAGDEGGGGSASGPTIPVVVAAQDIPTGTRLTAEMLTVRNIAETTVLTGAFSETDNVVGQVTVVPVVAGEQVLSTKVAGGDGTAAALGDDPPVSLILPEGQRAVSAPISNVAAVSGLVRPGDSVDLVLALQVDVKDNDGETIGRNTVAATFMQNVKVLSIDQDVTTTAVGDGDDAIGGNSPANEDPHPGAGTATFAVSPVHAEVLGLAGLCAEQYSGRLIISLRAFGDEGPVADRATYATDGPPPDCATLLSLDALP